jgi:sec-independent protein translocase protein TatC
MALSLKRRHEAKNRPDSMTLIEHLTELRRRVLVCAVAFIVAATVAFLVYNHILSFLQHPYCQVNAKHCNLYVTSPLDGLTLRVKIAAYGGIFLASPVILWELWRFITPGLNPKEKKYAIPFIVSSIFLFALGCLVAYITFPHALQFLDHIGGPSLQQIYNPNSYLSLILLLMTVFGLTFEFPVLLISLEIAGVLTPQTLSKWRRWAIVAIVVVAGVVTPSSDPFSMLAMAVPLYVFYEVSIVVGKVLARRSTGDPVSELETPTGSQ